MLRKRCAKCDAMKDISAYLKTRPDGTVAELSNCKRCENGRVSDRRRNGTMTAADLRRDRTQSRRHTKQRSQEEHRYKYLWLDSRSNDRNKGRENDLTKEFIKSEIGKECSYCGETGIQMTLDRVDNDLGHLMSNVVPACIRCNLARRGMPHKAWVVIAVAMREAREKGLFGDWTGQIQRKRRRDGTAMQNQLLPRSRTL